jgi:hypothetical protein
VTPQRQRPGEPNPGTADTALNNAKPEGTPNRSRGRTTRSPSKAAGFWSSAVVAEPELAKLAAVCRFHRHTLHVASGHFGVGTSDEVWHEVNRRLAVLVGPGRGRPMRSDESGIDDWDALVAEAVAEETAIAGSGERTKAGRTDLRSVDALNDANGYLWAVLKGEIE